MTEMRIDFWFDPACPYTWVTSRWLCRHASESSITIDWRPFSLAILHGDDDPGSPAQRGLRQLRVVEAVRKAGFEAQIGHLYTELGHRTHDAGDRQFRVVDAVAAAGLPPILAEAEHDESIDEAIRASMEEASALSGDDAGVPVIAWGDDEQRVGFFGPILTELPDLEAGERLFTAITELASIGCFSELKRRRNGRPVLPAVRSD
ncbi:MAG: DsbA family protein [Acidimicrobiia bacterium]|nr:DsbA family protein [Acidimicrobiia bacterium]